MDLKAIEYDCHLGGHDRHKDVEGRGTEAVPQQERAQEAKTQHHHHIHILELCMRRDISVTSAVLQLVT